MGQPGSINDIRPFAELAQNATTVVYKAYQTSLERFVLLKRLQPTYSGDEDLAARFQEEARIAARVQHPNVVSIYAFGRDDEGAYIVAEFVEGLDLGKLVERSRIPPDLALYVLAESARGLHAAHDKNVLHRDLKPANILISREGEVKLSDFGLASVSSVESPSEIRGTLAYLAPEQILDNALDARSDLFALGATFFEMLTGRRAFLGSTSQEIFEAILHRSPLPYLSATAGVDEEIETICSRLLARDPSDRYENARAVVSAVDACRRARDARLGAAALSTFLDDPSAVAMPRPDPAEPAVIVVPHDAERAVAGGVGGTLRKAVVAATVLVFAAALVYASVSLIRPPDDPGTFDRRGAGGIADTSSRNDSTVAMTGADTAAFAAAPDTAVLEPADTIAYVGGAAAPVADEDEAGDPVAEGISPVEEAEDVSPDDPRNVPGAVSDDTPSPGYLSVYVDTTAAIFVDGESVGIATSAEPLVLSFPPGEYALSVRNPAFPREDRRVIVRSDETVTVDHALWSTVGRLRLQVSPWAEVYVDGEHLGQATIFEPLIMKPGVYEFRFENSVLGVDTTTIITIPRGEIVSKDMFLNGGP